MITWKDKVEQCGIVMLEIEGDITYESLQPILEKVESIEAIYKKGFNRFTNLDYVRHMTLTSEEIWSISQRRNLIYSGAPVTSAIYACNKFMYGMFRIYASMMDPAPINVDVLNNLDECADWLGVSADALNVGRNQFDTI